MALAEAQSLAVGLDHQFIEPAHVLVALLDQQQSTEGRRTDRASQICLLPTARQPGRRQRQCAAANSSKAALDIEKKPIDLSITEQT